MKRRNPSSDEKVIEALQWVEVFRQSPSKHRTKRVRLILDALTSAAGDLDSSMSPKALRALKDMLENPKKFTLVGVVYQCRYFKVEGTDDELNAEWVHPYSVPTLMFASKDLPLVMLVNPALRFNKSFLADMPFNKDNPDAKNLRGKTG